jgi:hypothetical protein
VLRFVIVYLIPIALAIFGVVDCLLTPRPYVRALPKTLWIAVILLLYVVGPLLWIVAGRTEVPHARRNQNRRITDVRDGLITGLGEPGKRARPRPQPTPPPAEQGTGGGTSATGRSLAPDDDPEFLRKLGEQMRKDRPEG